MLDLGHLMTLATAWVLVSVPVSFIAGFLLSKNAEHYPSPAMIDSGGITASLRVLPHDPKAKAQ
jgi:hypothetical protein